MTDYGHVRNTQVEKSALFSVIGNWNSEILF